FRGTSGMYDRIGFTYEMGDAVKTYLEWESEAFGMPVSGSTTLTRNAAGSSKAFACITGHCPWSCDFRRNLADVSTAKSIRHCSIRGDQNESEQRTGRPEP
ncbi:MAG: hypothetical protein ABJA98_27000, partial [Acidobacteriota bacterium]